MFDKKIKSIYKGKIVQLSLERVRLPNGHVTELEIIKDLQQWWAGIGVLYID